MTLEHIFSIILLISASVYLIAIGYIVVDRLFLAKDERALFRAVKNILIDNYKVNNKEGIIFELTTLYKNRIIGNKSLYRRYKDIIDMLEKFITLVNLGRINLHQSEVAPIKQIIKTIVEELITKDPLGDIPSEQKWVLENILVALDHNDIANGKSNTIKAANEFQRLNKERLKAQKYTRFQTGLAIIGFIATVISIIQGINF